jgi:hypothetical protein
VKKLVLVLLVLLGFWLQTSAGRHTRVDLTATETGRRIFSVVLRDGERAVMSWRNSLFGLDVTEVFEAKRGTLVLDEVTFADPRGLAPHEVTPADVDDLYQTGGPFTAHGLGRAFNRVAYRVGEIGNPKMKIRECVVNYAQEVGFGGGLILTAVTPTWLEVLF